MYSLVMVFGYNYHLRLGVLNIKYLKNGISYVLSMKGSLIRLLSVILNYSGSRILDRHTMKVLTQLRDLPQDRPTNVERRIIFFCGYYFLPAHMVIDAILALIFRLRGWQVIGVIGSDFFKKECVYFGGNYKKFKSINIRWVTSLEKTLWKKVLKLPVLHIKEFSNTDDEKIALMLTKHNYSVRRLKNMHWSGLPLGKYAYNASVNLMDTNKLSENVKNIAFMTAHIRNMVRYTLAVERILKYIKPSAVISNSPFYYRWSIPFNIARKKNINVYSYMLATKRNSVFFSRNTPEMLKFDYDSAPDAIWKGERFETSEFRRVISEFSSGQHSYTSDLGFTSRYDSHQLNSVSQSKGKASLSILVPLNVPSDAAALQGSTIFSSLTEFTSYLVQFARENPSINFIFKVHPGEKYYGNRLKNSSMHKLLLDLGATELLNIKIIGSTAEVELSKILETTQIVCVYTSTITLEAAILGIPVIQCGNSGQYGLDFTYCPVSKQELSNLLMLFGTRSEMISLKERTRIATSALKYTFAYYGHGQCDLGFLELSDLMGMGSIKEECEINEILNSPPLNFIVDRIELEEPIFSGKKWPPLT